MIRRPLRKKLVWNNEINIPAQWECMGSLGMAQEDATQVTLVGYSHGAG